MRVRHILLVADRTACREHVRATIEDRANAGPCQVTLLVPAVRPRGGWTWDEQTARREARGRMEAAGAMLRRSGAAISTVLGDFYPLDAIRDELRRSHYDEIIISTYPAQVSRWLNQDLPSRVAGETETPVTHFAAADGVGESDVVPPARSPAA